MVIEQLTDSCYLVFFAESGKDELFAVAQNKDVPPAALLEFIIIESLAKICKEIHELKEEPPASPGMKGFEPSKGI